MLFKKKHKGSLSHFTLRKKKKQKLMMLTTIMGLIINYEWVKYHVVDVNWPWAGKALFPNCKPREKKKHKNLVWYAVAGDRTRVTRVTGGNTHHYTTTTWLISFPSIINLIINKLPISSSRPEMRRESFRSYKIQSI